MLRQPLSSPLGRRRRRRRCRHSYWRGRLRPRVAPNHAIIEGIEEPGGAVNAPGRGTHVRSYGMRFNSTNGIERQCLACGQTFWTSRWLIKKGFGRYCSRACIWRGKFRELHPRWQGGRNIDAKGYVRVTSPDGCIVYEHRLVMEQHLGRTLRGDEVVHHLGDRSDNRVEMLAVMSLAEHTQLHMRRGHPNALGERWAMQVDCCAQCGTTEIPHQARGLCRTCYKHQWYVLHKKD